MWTGVTIPTGSKGDLLPGPICKNILGTGTTKQGGENARTKVDLRGERRGERGDGYDVPGVKEGGRDENGIIGESRSLAEVSRSTHVGTQRAKKRPVS